MDADHGLTVVGRRVLRLIVWLLLRFSLGLALVVLALAAVGYRPLVIRSGSMTPTLQVGDVVLSRSLHPSAIARGDVVTFRDPGRGGALVTHRVVAMHLDAGHAQFETRGDANEVSENWSVAADGSVGKAVAVLSGIGWLVAALLSPWLRIVAIVLACVGIGIPLFRRIWATR